MSIFTRARNAVTGTVRDVADRAVNTVGGVVSGGLSGGLLGAVGGGLQGLLGGQALPAMQSGGLGGTMQTSGLGGYQNNLENLSQMIGQPQVSQTSTTSGGGLI